MSSWIAPDPTKALPDANRKLGATTAATLNQAWYTIKATNSVEFKKLEADVTDPTADATIHFNMTGVGSSKVTVTYSYVSAVAVVGGRRGKRRSGNDDVTRFGKLLSEGRRWARSDTAGDRAHSSATISSRTSSYRIRWRTAGHDLNRKSLTLIALLRGWDSETIDIISWIILLTEDPYVVLDGDTTT